MAMRSLPVLALATVAQTSALAFVGSTRPLAAAPRGRPSRTPSIQMSTKGFVITGGAGGVGYAYADELVRRGHWVVICDVKDPEPAVQARLLISLCISNGIGMHGFVKSFQGLACDDFSRNVKDGFVNLSSCPFHCRQSVKSTRAASAVCTAR
eukprot:1569749-Pleurochrysis_carterae.AAC.2